MNMEITERLQKMLDHYIDENLKMRDEMAAEATYKFSNLMITLNVGIISAMSFVFSNVQNLQPISKILSLFLLLSVISIHLEIKFKNKVIEINREAADRRATFLINLYNKDVLELMNHPNKESEKFMNINKALSEKLTKGFNDVSAWLRVEEKKPFKLRKTSSNFLIITLIAIILITVIETNTARLLLNFFSSFIK